MNDQMLTPSTAAKSFAKREASVRPSRSLWLFYEFALLLRCLVLIAMVGVGVGVWRLALHARSSQTEVQSQIIKLGERIAGLENSLNNLATTEKDNQELISKANNNLEAVSGLADDMKGVKTQLDAYATKSGELDQARKKWEYEADKFAAKQQDLQARETKLQQDIQRRQQAKQQNVAFILINSDRADFKTHFRNILTAGFSESLEFLAVRQARPEVSLFVATGDLPARLIHYSHNEEVDNTRTIALPAATGASQGLTREAADRIRDGWRPNSTEQYARIVIVATPQSSVGQNFDLLRGHRVDVILINLDASWGPQDIQQWTNLAGPSGGAVTILGATGQSQIELASELRGAVRRALVLPINDLDGSE